MKLNNNTILITGGSSGIGFALAQKFVELDNEVIITGRNEARLQEAKKALPTVHTIVSDASNDADIKRLASTLEQDFPQLNVLVNNAGVFRFMNLANQENLSELTQELDINLAGPIKTTSVLMPLICKNKGTIINVTSGLAFVPMQAAPLYCATKAALHSYTQTLRQQMVAHDVEVVEVMPPATKTPMTAHLPEDGAFKLLPLEKMIDETFKGLRKGTSEIRVGETGQLRFMSRLAPNFIANELAKGSKDYVPKRA